MADDLRAETSRYEAAKEVMVAQHQETLRSLKEKLQREVDATIERNAEMKTSFEQAFTVEFSRKKVEYDEKLAELRDSMTKQIESQKLNGEAEVEKTKGRYREQINRYREIGDKQIADIHRQYQKAADDLHLRTEKERSKS